MNSAKPTSDRTFISTALSRTVVISAIKVALVVGTLLALINHYDKLATLSFSRSDISKIFLTYLVPYGVSTWSAVKALQTKK